MQPENSPGVVPGAEQFPMPPAMGPEGAPSLPPLETGMERGQERFEQAAEAGAYSVDATAPVVPVQPMPAVPVSAPVQQAPEQAVNAPIVAADEDLIEKEWVDRAKEIVTQTQGDPYTRSEQVIGLRNDYQQKRTASAGNPPIGSQ